VATLFGFVVAALATAGAVFTFFQRIFAEQFAKIGLGPVPGFATTVIAVLFLGAVQLICIGILGEYVGRIYDNVKGRPQYTVGRRVGFERPPRE
jgi:dolichol-phosphate mannosyltransferase